MQPDYEKYTLEELYDVLNHIDKGAFPERYKTLLSQIERRQGEQKDIVTEQRNSKDNEDRLKSTAKQLAPISLPEPREPLSAAVITNYRFVAAILFLQALIVLLQILFLPDLDTKVYWGALIVDLILAIILVVEPNRVAASIVAIRAGIGVFVQLFKLIPAGEYLLTLLGTVLYSAMIILVVKELSRRSRTVVISTAFSILTILAAANVDNIIAVINPKYKYSLAASPITKLQGEYFEYELMLPTRAEWYLRDRSAFVKDNPAVDQWVVNPKSDAHITIIAEQFAPGLSLDMDSFKEKVLDNAKRISTRFRELEPLPTKNDSHTGIIVHTKSNINLVDFEYFYGLYLVDDYAFQVIAFSNQKEFGKLKKTLIEIINSFRYIGQARNTTDNKQAI